MTKVMRSPAMSTAHADTQAPSPVARCFSCHIGAELLIIAGSERRCLMCDAGPNKIERAPAIIVAYRAN
jgi:hypothetical protein